MDILSEVLEVLDLKCTGVLPISPSAAHAGRAASLQAFFIVSGECTLRYLDEDAEFELRSLDCVLLAGDNRHEIQPCPDKSSSPARLLRCVYALDRDLPHPLARHLPQRLLLRSRDLTDESELGRAAWLLEGEMINARLGFDFVAQRFADIMLVEMLRRCQLDGPRPVFLAALSDPVIHDSLKLIHGKLDHRWQVPELANSVGLSRAAFAGTVSPAGRGTTPALPPVLANAQRPPRVAPVDRADQGCRSTCRLRIRRGFQTGVPARIRACAQYIAVGASIRTTHR